MADDWYIAGGSTYDEPNYYVSVFIHDVGFPKGEYGTDAVKMQTKGSADDPFWSLGVDTETWTYGEKQAEFGLLEGYRFKADVNSCWVWDDAGGAWVDLLAGGVPHPRQHEMTDPLDHESDDQWVMWYADGAGPPADVQNFALGGAGDLIVSQGAAAAPIFTKTINGCNAEANALIVTDGVIQVKIWCDGADTHIKTDGGDIILDPAGGDVTCPGASKVWDACWN
jgi:hypothetical protein